jgi:hypothetical protein
MSISNRPSFAINSANCGGVPRFLSSPRETGAPRLALQDRKT